MLKITKSTILSWLELPNGLQFSVIGSSKWNNFCAEWSRGRISSKSKNTLCISPNVSRWATMLSSLTWLGITRGNGRAGTTGLMRWSPTQRTFWCNPRLIWSLNFPRWWALEVSLLCQLLVRWTTNTCLRQASSHTGRLFSTQSLNSKTFFLALTDISSTGSTSPAQGWASRPPKSPWTNLQSVWHCSLPRQLKSLACGWLGKQPDSCDGSQLDHRPTEAGEQPHQVGLMITKHNTAILQSCRSHSSALSFLCLTGCHTHSGWQPQKTPWQWYPWSAVRVGRWGESHLRRKVFEAPLLALRLFSLHSGNIQRTVKQLEDGRTVGWKNFATRERDIFLWYIIVKLNCFSWRLLRQWRWMKMVVYSWWKAMEDSTLHWFSGLRSKSVYVNRFCKAYPSSFGLIVFFVSLRNYSPSGDHLGDLPSLGVPHKILVKVGEQLNIISN